MNIRLPATWKRSWRAVRPWLLFGLAVLLLWLVLEFLLRIGLGLRLLPGLPPAWLLPSAGKAIRILAWLHLNTGIGVALAVLPVAAGLAVFAPRRGQWIAIVVTTLMIVTHPMLLEYLPIWSTLEPLQRVTILADLVKQALTLPLLTMLCRWLLAKWRRARSHPAAAVSAAE